MFPVAENSLFGFYIGLCNFAEILHAHKKLNNTGKERERSKKAYVASFLPRPFFLICVKKTKKKQNYSISVIQ